MSPPVETGSAFTGGGFFFLDLVEETLWFLFLDIYLISLSQSLPPTTPLGSEYQQAWGRQRI
jgi:hypothetical protein